MPDFQIRLGMYVFQTATVDVSADTLAEAVERALDDGLDIPFDVQWDETSGAFVVGASPEPGRDLPLAALPFDAGERATLERMAAALPAADEHVAGDDDGPCATCNGEGVVETERDDPTSIHGVSVGYHPCPGCAER